jgi:outer membrane protein assembly factor BamE (lipoprotein component of BamABCDE complex)
MRTEDVSKYKDFNAALLLAPLILFILFSGCATSGTRGSANLEKAMSQITKGTTTKEEVRRLLGDPGGVYKNSNGTEMWTYLRNELQKKMAQKSTVAMGAAGAGQFVGMFIPFAGPAINAVAMGNVASTKGTYEALTINFDSKGIVSDVSSFTQEIGKQ